MWNDSPESRRLREQRRWVVVKRLVKLSCRAWHTQAAMGGDTATLCTMSMVKVIINTMVSKLKLTSMASDMHSADSVTPSASLMQRSRM